MNRKARVEVPGMGGRLRQRLHLPVGRQGENPLLYTERSRSVRQRLKRKARPKK